MKLLIMQFSPISNHFISLQSKYSPQHPVLKHTQSVQTNWGFGLFSIISYSTKIENTTFRKLDLFPSSSEEGKDTYSTGTSY
jgi:hypothetical protein